MILGLDPGSKETGWAELHEHGVRSGFSPNGSILTEFVLFDGPVAIESLRGAYAGRPIGVETFDTARWEGRFIERARKHGCKVFLIARSTVQAHFSAKGDAGVKAALIDLYGGESVAREKPHRCPECKGRGVVGRKPGLLECPTCSGAKTLGQFGPLAYVRTSHEWAALAVAIAVRDGAKCEEVVE